MARTKDAVLAPGQKELMEKEYLDFVKNPLRMATKPIQVVVILSMMM